jgi:hypothetical protein
MTDPHIQQMSKETSAACLRAYRSAVLEAGNWSQERQDFYAKKIVELERRWK